MGRGRLRRGCSLEVIFEEDPDFCSHLDSLDGGVAIRFGIKEPDDNISLDSLLEVEEYQVRFQDPADAEQVFRSLDGFIDVRNMDSCMVEWDEFSMDSNSSKTGDESGIVTTDRNTFLDSNEMAATNNAEKAPSGRRSRVSRRQIIQATWLGYSSSSDESVTNNDLDENDNKIGAATTSGSVAPSKPPRRRSPSTRHNKLKQPSKDTEEKNDETSCEPCTSSSSISSLPLHSTAKVNSPSVTDENNNDSSLNLVTSVEDFLESDRKEGTIGLKTPIQLHLRSSPNMSMEGVHHAATTVALPPYAIFGRSDTLDILEKDTLDSYISTMTDETDTNAYTFADPFDDTHSVASTNYESSGSTSSTESNGSVCTVNSFSMQNGKSSSNENNEFKTTNSSGSDSPNIITKGDVERGSSSGSKYRSNLKVDLVSQLNKSQERNLHSTTTASATASTTIPPNLYSRNSYLHLQSPPSTSVAAPLVGEDGNKSASPSHQQRQQNQPMLLNHQQQQSLSDNERQACAGEVKRVRALFELRNHSRTSPNGSDRSGSSSNGSTCPSSPESMSRSISSRNGGDASPCGSSSGRVGLYAKNGRRSRASPQNHRGSTAASPSKLLKSTYGTNASLSHNAVGGSNSNIHALESSSPVAGNNQSSYDYVDILVNDNVVIEDAPDIYQTTRSRRHTNFDRDSIPSPPTSNKRPVTLMNIAPQNGTCLGGGSLRRSQSMGTGISSLGGPSTYGVGSGILKQSSSKTSILAEELPAPDTVKNVRNVFENMLKIRSNNHGSENSVDMSSSTPTGFSGSFSIVKKSLSYIKSNPTSKIYRSESMRDDFPSMGRRFGKPVLMSETHSPAPSPCHSSFVAPSSSTPTTGSGSTTARTISTTTVDSGSIKFKCSALTNAAGDVVDGCSGSSVRGVGRRSSCVSSMNKNPIERKISEPAKFSPKINTGLSPSSVPSMLRTSCQVPLTEEDPSYSSNVSTTATEDYRSRKYVHPDVLNKIRSAGTTTTYFGGKIVAKTIKNRKIPVSRRHTFDLQDYVGISGDGACFSNNYDSYNSSNYYRDDETGESKCRGCATSTCGGCGAAETGGYGRSGSSRPALEIPLKSSSSSSFYASQNTTISGALDSIFSGGVGGLLTFASKPIDTTPRIISVLHKSPPGSHTGSPVKSCSPVSSVIEEGRNSPEGCEASNEKTVVEQDGNNNNLPRKANSSPSPGNCTGESKDFNKKFSQITEGAWF